MKHHMYNPDFDFIVGPESFNKYTDRELLQYCLGATMYMPGFKDFTPKILNHSIPGLTTMVLCFEDACPEELVPQAENNIATTNTNTDNLNLFFIINSSQNIFL